MQVRAAMSEPNEVAFGGLICINAVFASPQYPLKWWEGDS
jgi:hypothetical protein